MVKKMRGKARRLHRFFASRMWHSVAVGCRNSSSASVDEYVSCGCLLAHRCCCHSTVVLHVTVFGVVIIVLCFCSYFMRPSLFTRPFSGGSFYDNLRQLLTDFSCAQSLTLPTLVAPFTVICWGKIWKQLKIKINI